ncbi:hypothetical protein [Bradyrhizobium sp. 195]|uniref:hypothetical protein n=1 Tax=Bradyrhizobium sp. 195 TaxID=2782662 RepID=UPI0020006424|nr:hypothetical protein [Bradyrhizobium sp. 195]UPK28391.1 hypothetical protein IVB26_08230 [Bradyrhizobium sp. 195]
MADYGQVDTSIYKDAVSDSPLKTAGEVADYRNKLLSNVQNEQSVQANNIKLATERFGMVNSAAAGLLSDPNLGKADVTKKLWDTLGRLTKGDAMSAQHAVQFMKGFPTDPQQQRAAIEAVHAQTLDAWQRGKAYLGTVEGVGTGGGTKLVQQPAYGGAAPRDIGYIPNTLQPGTEKVNPDLSRSFVGGEGNPRIQGPAGEPVNLLGNYGPAPSSAGPSRQPIRERNGAPAGATQRPQAQAGSPYPSSPRPASASPSARVMAAPAPGEAEAKRAVGEGSGSALVSARQRAMNYQGEVFPLEQAIPALEKLGTKGTGPGTESINHLKSFVLSNIPGADFKGLKDDVETYDKAKKYLVDFVNQNGNAGTNDKLAASFAGNPSVNISNAAAVDVAKSALALRRVKQAQLAAFEQSGLPESEFGKFASKWNVMADPRAYGFDLMTPAQRKAVIESLPKGKRELFMLNVQDAVEQGLIKAPK